MREKPYLRVVTALFATSLVLAVVESAFASNVSVDINGTILYTAAPGEANAVTIARPADAPFSGKADVSDPGATITPGAGCTSASAHTVVWPALSRLVWTLAT